MGGLARLQSLRRAGADRGDAACDQFRRRRAQSARNRRDRGRPEAGQERPVLPDPGQQRDPRPSHHRERKILQTTSAGTTAERTAADDVKAYGHSAPQAGMTTASVTGTLARTRPEHAVTELVASDLKTI